MSHISRPEQTSDILDHLATFPRAVENVKPEELWRLLGEIHGQTLRLLVVHDIIVGRLYRDSRQRETRAASPPAERLLNARQAATVLGVALRWMRRHSPRLPFAKKLSYRSVRYSEVGIRKWLQTRRAS